MRFSERVLLAAAAVASVAAASDVHDLKKDTFEVFMQEHELVLAEFFAPWCGHCKALAPEYEEAATTLKEQNIALAKVDCTEEADLCQDYGVQGYPTLKVFQGPTRHTPYEGQRKADAIVSYMTKAALPPVSDVTKESIEDFKITDPVTIIAYFENKDTKTNETFTEIAEGLRQKYLFGATNDAELAKAEGAKQPSIVLYKSFDEGKVVYDGKFEKAAIEKWLKTSSTPLVGEVGPETYADYMAAGIPLGYIFAATKEEREELAKEAKSVAEKHKGVINIATIDAGAFGQHAQNLNLEVGKWPAFAIQDTVKNLKFPFDQTKKITSKDLGKFVDDYVSGKLEPSIKSEPIPETQEGPVTVIVAKNYEDIVMKNKKDVLVEFYAPWCGHCKALAPKYDELAQLFASHDSDVTIAKVDATANDVPGEIQGFPTIKLFPANDKDTPVDYTGSRTVEDLAKFIAENGSHKIDVTNEAAALASGTKKSATEDMQHQAPAATDKGTAEKIKETAEKVVEAVAGMDDSIDDHDEL